MIKYDYDFIISIRNSYIIDPRKYSELKKHEIPSYNITKKQQQLNIKYQSNKWRYNDKEDMFKKKINGVLNKISLDNYDELKNMIQNIGNNITIDKYNDFEFFVDRIINKIIEDPFYSDVYGKLLKDICKYKWYCINNNKNIDTSYISFFELLLIKVKELYDEIYDGTNTNKTNCINIISLINQLYKNNILSNRIYISCLYGLLNNPSDLNIELVSKMLKKCGDIINDKDINGIIEKVKIIYETIKNTRLKYMLLDIIELNENGWKEVIVDNTQKSDVEEKLGNILDEFVMNENVDDILYILEEYKKDDILKFIELGIKTSFNYKDKQLVLSDLFNEIIMYNKFDGKQIGEILNNIFDNIEDIMLDSPKCIEIFNNILSKFIENKNITTQLINNILSNKTDNIKKLFSNYTFNVVKKPFKKLENKKVRPRY
jgi:hypothetical protein